MNTLECDEVHSIVDFILYEMNLAEIRQTHLQFLQTWLQPFWLVSDFFFEIYTSMVYEEGIKLFSIHLIL